MIALTPIQWALMALAGFLTGMSKTGITGLSILAVAIAASVLPARDSVGAVLVIFIAGDMMAIATYRRIASWPDLRRIFPWAGLGVLIGVVALGRIDNQGARRLIGAILITLIGAHFIRQRLTNGTDAEALPLARYPALVGLTGMLAGFTTMVSNAAGPIMIIYLLALRLPKEIFVGTTAWFFLVLNLFKAPFSVGLGLINPATLGVALPVIPFVVVGAFVGRWLLARLPQRRFEQIALTLALAAGLRLAIF
ncbi:MAG: sulfite exporter TauE/SafE family protein [Anaerolineae bacterium]|nr:sulfite exporter TauE/SafE family protein [Anaerolineae bacterium]